MPDTDHSTGGRRLRWRRGRVLVAVVAVVLVAVIAGLVFGRSEPQPTNQASDVSGGSSASSASPSAPSQSGSPSATGQDGTDGDLQVGPIPQKVPTSGSGTTSVLTVPGHDSGRSGRRVRYTVETEGGLGVSSEYFAAKVRKVLTDERGWEPKDGVHFVNVSPQRRAAGAATDIRIILASPHLVDRSCAPLATGGRLSCHSHGKVMLNVDRWAHGADTYGSDVKDYRDYQISHEVGHSIGHGHVGCPKAGSPAPVMVQQTKSLYGCTPWPWPQPPNES